MVDCSVGTGKSALFQDVNELLDTFAKKSRYEAMSQATADVIEEKSSMSDRLFFERLSEQVSKDFANIAATCVPVERKPEGPMAVARLLSKGHSFG